MCFRQITTLIIVSLLSLTPALAADPDFTGTWQLSRQRSDLRPLPAAPWERLTVTQDGQTVRCESTSEGGAPVAWRFTLDGKETRSAAGVMERRAAAKWEGAALLVNTVVMRRDGQHTEADRWKLSRDGSTLTIRRQCAGRYGEVEALLVYERQ